MIKILICGDFRAMNASKVSADDRFQELLSNSDYVVCNFEAPISSNGIAIKKSGPALDQDINSPEILKRLGFNVFLMANNHIMDYGVEGCKKTLDAFDDCVCVGAGKGNDAFKVKIVEKEGKRIGFLSFVQHEFGVIEAPSEDSFGAAWINSYYTEDIIKEAKENVDFLLVLPHAGVEHTEAPLPEWRHCYKKLIDWGADIVIASHPHCPQGRELYKGKYIYYSLGNLYFDGLSGYKMWDRSLAVSITIDDLTTKIDTQQIVFNIDGMISIDESVEQKDYIAYLNKLLVDAELYNNYIKSLCQENFKGIKFGLLRGLCGFSWHIRSYYAMRLLFLMIIKNRDEMYLLNSYQNESHRWLIERYLRNNNK